MKVIDFKPASCKHCYKCVRSCSVKAIRVTNAQAQIMNEYCVLCGHCLEVCPQNAKTFASDMDVVKVWLKQGDKVVVSLAPSYLGILKYRQPGQVVDGLKKLGFYQVRETAEGAAYVTAAYSRLLEAGKMKNIITTCCPSINDLVEKYYPDLTPYLAPVVSPMVAHGMLIKELCGKNTKVVFIGPCIAKKEEAEGDVRTRGYVDGVITFEELEQWFAGENIDLCQCGIQKMDNPDPKVNRLYPVQNGVITSVMKNYEAAVSGENLPGRGAQMYRKIFVDGIGACRELFDGMERGEFENCFIEANMCEGGCINGPAVNRLHVSRFKAKMNMEQQIEYEDPGYAPFPPQLHIEKMFYSRANKDHMPTEEQIQVILKATGKYNKDQELNCGACGYPTCRDKAIAVFQGKAEQEMCLPHAYEKAHSMANVVMETTPNAIFILDNDLKILEFNRMAQKFFGISKEDAMKSYLFEIMETQEFEEVLKDHHNILRRRMDLKQYGLKTLETIVYIEDMDGLLCILQDVSKDEERLEKEYEKKLQMVGSAQDVIDKQMMVAQEIAGLLGETTAETKIILSRLGDLISSDEQD
ncbi:PAS domain S-box-containing protein [Catenibacillus scindens]|uniref:PAS domain S-box-containing protein n=1 Tax=Catenibacillus scindens TaxID=673271 RepID=A0A7W8M3V2_9FIRM|nr:[Fe-Fe] hydrogenase large subunit C-terminal domain-containing protein [Catenibacillus scindens]MBB5263169.1 PAS domain S-box-containing protein [Catenibacillus scindens]